MCYPRALRQIGQHGIFTTSRHSNHWFAPYAVWPPKVVHSSCTSSTLPATPSIALLIEARVVATSRRTEK